MSCLLFPLLAHLFIVTTWFSIITLFASSVVAFMLLNLALHARRVAKGIEQKTGYAKKILIEYKFPDGVLGEMSKAVGFSMALARQNQAEARTRGERTTLATIA